MSEKGEKRYSWLQEKDDGNYIVKTKIGDIELTEVNGEDFDKAMSLSEKTGKDPASILVMKSIVDKEKYNDREILKLPGSVYIRLKIAVTDIYGISDFLAE